MTADLIQEMRSRSKEQLVVCVCNEGYSASLERGKLYCTVPDAASEAEGLIRVFDESGEDYLYDAAWFKAITLPENVRIALSKSNAAGRARRRSVRFRAR